MLIWLCRAWSRKSFGGQSETRSLSMLCGKHRATALNESKSRSVVTWFDLFQDHELCSSFALSSIQSLPDLPDALSHRNVFRMDCLCFCESLYWIRWKYRKLCSGMLCAALTKLVFWLKITENEKNVYENLNFTWLHRTYFHFQSTVSVNWKSISCNNGRAVFLQNCHHNWEPTVLVQLRRCIKNKFNGIYFYWNWLHKQ